MRSIIPIAFAAGLVLAAAIAGFWASSLPAGSARTAESVDVHSLTIKTKELPPQQIDSLY